MGNYLENVIKYIKLDSEYFGIFVVKDRYTDLEFPTLTEAKKFYDMIDAPKALWDCTSMPELLISESLQD